MNEQSSSEVLSLEQATAIYRKGPLSEQDVAFLIALPDETRAEAYLAAYSSYDRHY